MISGPLPKLLGTRHKSQEKLSTARASVYMRYRYLRCVAEKAGCAYDGTAVKFQKEKFRKNHQHQRLGDFRMPHACMHSAIKGGQRTRLFQRPADQSSGDDDFIKTTQRRGCQYCQVTNFSSWLLKKGPSTIQGPTICEDLG